MLGRAGQEFNFPLIMGGLLTFVPDFQGVNSAGFFNLQGYLDLVGNIGAELLDGSGQGEMRNYPRLAP